MQCAHLQGMQSLSYIIDTVVSSELEWWQVRYPASLLATSTGHATCSQDPELCVSLWGLLSHSPEVAFSPRCIPIISCYSQAYCTRSDCSKLASPQRCGQKNLRELLHSPLQCTEDPRGDSDWTDKSRAHLWDPSIWPWV